MAYSTTSVVTPVKLYRWVVNDERLLGFCREARPAAALAARFGSARVFLIPREADRDEIRHSVGENAWIVRHVPGKLAMAEFRDRRAFGVNAIGCLSL